MVPWSLFRSSVRPGGFWGPSVVPGVLVSSSGSGSGSVLAACRGSGPSFPGSRSPLPRLPDCLNSGHTCRKRSNIRARGKNAFPGLLALRGAWSADGPQVVRSHSLPWSAVGPGAVGAVMISQRFPVLPIAAVGCIGAGCVQPTNTVGCSLIPSRFYLLPRWVVLRVIPSSAVGYSAFYLLTRWVIR